MRVESPEGDGQVLGDRFPVEPLKIEKIIYNKKKMSHELRGSSMVEQLTVNQLVVGSNPTPGAGDLSIK